MVDVLYDVNYGEGVSYRGTIRHELDHPLQAYLDGVLVQVDKDCVFTFGCNRLQIVSNVEGKCEVDFDLTSTADTK